MRNKTVNPSFAGALAVLVAVFLVAVPAIAQDTSGSLGGVVTAAEDGSALPGVTITATSEAGQSLVQVSDANGRYRFPVMTVGSWSISAALDGFQSLSQAGIRISVGTMASINLAMPAGSIEETILVTSEAPMVDMSSTVTGVTVGADFADKIPIVRDVYQVALIAPGTTTGDTAFDSNGSNYTPGQSVSSIGGGSVAENSYMVNGLNITNFRNGVGGSAVPFEFVQEVQVKTGGYEAEFGRSTGGVLNMVTKSGSNNWHGGVNFYFNPESMQEQSPDYFNGYNSQEFFKSSEGNLTIGGPIWKDHLFFFGFYQGNDFENSAVGITRETVRSWDDPYYGGKLDINFTPNHRIEGTYFTDEVTVTSDEYLFDEDTLSRGELVGTGDYDAGGTNAIAKYTGIFGRNFVVGAQYGENEFNRTSASDGDVCPYVLDSRGDSTLALGCWVNWNRGLADDAREAARIDLDYFVGNHSLRAGWDDEVNTSNDVTSYSGGEYYRYFINGTRFPQVDPGQELTRFRIFEGGGQFDTLSSALYIQDSWEVGEKWLLNLGIRSANFDNQNALGESFIKEDGQIAPRVGFTYDMRGDGRSKLYGSAGRYHLYIASNTNIRLAGAELFTEDWYTKPAGCNEAMPDFDACTGQVLQMNVFGDGEVPPVSETKSENVGPMYQDEFVIGYEKMVGEDWSLGLRGIYRDFSTAIEDITIDEAIGVEGAFEYRLVNPGKNFIGEYDGQPVEYSAEELGYPAPERNYYAVDFTFNRRFTDNWMLQGSLTWAHSYGNYEGYVRSDNGQDDAGITTLYDFAGLMEGAYGNLPNDRRYNAKAYGAYRFDMGLYLGGGFFWRDGRPLNAFGVHPTDPFAALYGAESFFDEAQELTPRGTVGNTSAVTNFDMTVKYDWELGAGTLTARLDAFNLFDQSTVTEVDEGAQEESGSPNPTYLEATRFQRPRRVRFLLGFNF